MGIYQSSKTKAVKALVSGGLSTMRVVPDTLLMRTADWCLRDINYPEGRDFLKTILLLAKRQLDTKAPAVQQSILNFIANVTVKGEVKRKRFKEEVGFDPPVLLVISPTMRCNLQCYGCYAGRYSRTDDLGLGTFERLLYEAEAMGIYFITVSGGEPFMLGDDFLTILGRHRSILFQIYTNGMLIDRGAAARLAQIGNAYPCISVVGWYFHYVPVGKKPGIELMPTAEQRLFRREELVKRRARHDILLADFWNDGPMVGGCLAGGRTYLHINSNGEVEPCVFAHFAVDNIREKPLRDILQSPFFTEIRRRQPYDDNLLRPCMIIDVPEVLREVVTVCGAHPTHYGADAVINELAQDMDRYSETYHRMADTKWCEYQSKNGK